MLSAILSSNTKTIHNLQTFILKICNTSSIVCKNGELNIELNKYFAKICTVTVSDNTVLDLVSNWTVKQLCAAKSDNSLQRGFIFYFLHFHIISITDALYYSRHGKYVFIKQNWQEKSYQLECVKIRQLTSDVVMAY